ncbi:Protein DNA-DAMAGE INDUCIBLE 1 [Camellia lanceoleosa]|uniref:Protein DNA-DAMAGE INDUCIBLE 1 n=1 Tax=Camellia lanceoleosa TaxID=1840588 RepID=A0ACC0GDF9_9ERIC|nr:Protein DNA-DAMAGE INDUCIBLE 1 [Camellia lanceoleosa]
MNVRSEMHNIDSKSNRRDYLSAGKTNPPLIYFFFFLIYISMDGIWTYVLYTKRLFAYRIHFFMISVLILKALNLLCETEESDESVENLKALLEVEQQQLLYNGKEMRNAEKLSGLGVNDRDLVMIVSHAASSR